ncbi:MAG: hypothetical protein ABIZ64_05615 [Casimicrobium sp.]
MADDAAKRALIISFAMAEVNAHSHYMKGGDGSVPGGAAGLRRTTSLIEDLKIANLGIHAAHNSFGTCRGRWEELAPLGKQFAKGNVDRDQWLPAYLDELKASGQPPTQWKSFNGSELFPRLSAGYLYLGEDCRNKRHFDCEGLVAWAIVKALGKDPGIWRKGVDWYKSGGAKRLTVYKAAGPEYVHENVTLTQSDILDGDILIRKPNDTGSEHIALACVGGTGVLEASGKDRGVIRSTYKANWSHLARINKL